MATSASVENSETLISVDAFRKLVNEHFFSKITEEQSYDAKDLQRFNEVDDYAQMFIRHGQIEKKFDEQKALKIFHAAMVWRKQNNVFDISSTQFPADFFERGAIFYKNYDLQNNRLLHFVIRTFVKGRDDNDAVKRFIIYHFEEHIRSRPAERVVILFDMSETGLRHLDYDLVKFIMHLLIHAYPGFLPFMLIYKLPFILQAAWRLIRSWLPVETQEAVKFVDDKTIVQYIALDQLPKAMGGTVSDWP